MGVPVGCGHCTIELVDTDTFVTTSLLQHVRREFGSTSYEGLSYTVETTAANLLLSSTMNNMAKPLAPQGREYAATMIASHNVA